MKNSGDICECVEPGARTEDGDTLGHTAVRRGEAEHVETLAAQERCDCWNLTNRQSGHWSDIIDLFFSWSWVLLLCHKDTVIGIK